MRKKTPKMTRIDFMIGRESLKLVRRIGRRQDMTQSEAIRSAVRMWILDNHDKDISGE